MALPKITPRIISRAFEFAAGQIEALLVIGEDLNDLLSISHQSRVSHLYILGPIATKPVISPAW